MFETYGFDGVHCSIQAVLTLYAQGLLTGTRPLHPPLLHACCPLAPPLHRPCTPAAPRRPASRRTRRSRRRTRLPRLGAAAAPGLTRPPA